MFSSIKNAIKKTININKVTTKNQQNNNKTSKYFFIRELGQGGHSIVNQVKKDKLLFVSKEFDNKHTRNAYKEINVLKRIKNSNGKFPIYVEHIKEDNKIKVITKWEDSVDLFDWYTKNKKKITLKDKKKIFLGMIGVVKKLHQKKLMHLDLKLENFLITKKDKKIILIDFDMCQLLSENKKLYSITGTRGYSPPEIYKGYYSENSDTWSLGVCLWVLLNSNKPFNHDTLTYGYYKNFDKLIYETGLFSFPSIYHSSLNIDDDIMDLLGKIFKINPEERISLAEIEEHKWFK